jgi:hypothetical protein
MATQANFLKGDDAEAKFMKVATELGWEVTPSTLEEDRNQHIDFVIQWGDPMGEGPAVSYSVDVKSRNTAANGEEIWIELRNTLGQAGYLYSNVDLIAFDMGDRFMLIERDTLRLWCEENIEKDYVTLAHQAVMKVYTRRGKKDMLSLVPTHKLIPLAMGVMKYD